MKIGIFGDSYAFHHDFWPSDSWITLLAKDFDVRTYGENGSSTYFSYELLKKHYLKYDKIIFVITKFDRIHTSFKPIPSYDMVKFYLSQGDLTPFNRKVLEGLSDFILYSMADSEIEQQFMTLHLLLLKEIQSMGLDILFIRAFDDHRHKELQGPALWHITKMEQDRWGKRWDNFKKQEGFNFDTRQCHLTTRNNEILYEQLKEMLPSVKGNQFYNFDIFKFALPDSIDNYMPDHLKGKV